ncbi:hypothetical protein bpmyx0001_29920 [Bacillus pseudomycoides DSM 12442]|nr:hypothetical protein bpmyx0001_29920 [Bacillus pseudomycoides DSM 12442]
MNHSSVHLYAFSIMDKKRDRSDYNHKYNVEFMNVLYMRGAVVQSV